MRELAFALMGALVLSGCALLQGTEAGEEARQRIVEGLAVYCTQPQAVRLQNRAWINENSPHTIEVTCATDVPE